MEQFTLTSAASPVDSGKYTGISLIYELSQLKLKRWHNLIMILDNVLVFHKYLLHENYSVSAFKQILIS